VSTSEQPIISPKVSLRRGQQFRRCHQRARIGDHLSTLLGVADSISLMMVVHGLLTVTGYVLLLAHVPLG